MTHQDEAPRPDGPLYAVGDIHGCAALLDRMLTLIEADLAAAGLKRANVIFLGDYIDRGDDSARVLARLFHFARAVPKSVTCLMGNHEQMLLDFLDHPAEAGSRFLRHGGLQTLLSFRIGGVTERSGPQDLTSAAARLRAALPEGMEDWLRNLPTLYQSGDVVCVHAGLDPAKPIDAQTDRHLLWGHEMFFLRTRSDGLWTVHGHTVVDDPIVRKRRIATDTGAYFSGRLTCAVIYPDQPVRFLHT